MIRLSVKCQSRGQSVNRHVIFMFAKTSRVGKIPRPFPKLEIQVDLLSSNKVEDSE